APTLVDQATACISVRTAPPVGLPLGSPLRDVPRSLVLCVADSARVPLAIRTFVNAACRGEWKQTHFAVRYGGGGDYTTFGGCLARKSGVAAAQLTRAQLRHSKACAVQLKAAPRVWSPSPTQGFGVYVVNGAC